MPKNVKGSADGASKMKPTISKGGNAQKSEGQNKGCKEKD